MHPRLRETAKKLLHTPFEQLLTLEQRVIQHVATGGSISRPMYCEYDDSRASLGKRLADRVAVFGWSWLLIILFGALWLTWVLLDALTSCSLCWRRFRPPL